MSRPIIPEEPSATWALVTRFSLAGILLLVFGGLAVLFLPRLKAHQAADAKIDELRERVAELERKRGDMENQKILLTNDAKFIEIKARDMLDLQKDGETVFRFKD